MNRLIDLDYSRNAGQYFSDIRATEPIRILIQFELKNLRRNQFDLSLFM